jgi:hypothetical protein
MNRSNQLVYHFANQTGSCTGILEEKVDFDNLNLHTGFYKYVFEKTFDDDDPNRLKYHEVLDDISRYCKKIPITNYT